MGVTPIFSLQYAILGGKLPGPEPSGPRSLPEWGRVGRWRPGGADAPDGGRSNPDGWPRRRRCVPGRVQGARTRTRQSFVISSASVLRQERINSNGSMVPTLPCFAAEYKGNVKNAGNAYAFPALFQYCQGQDNPGPRRRDLRRPQPPAAPQAHRRSACAPEGRREPGPCRKTASPSHRWTASSDEPTPDFLPPRSRPRPQVPAPPSRR